jgi:hypothetical protein
MFLLEKKFNVEEEKGFFFVDAFDVENKLVYRFNYEADGLTNLIEIEIEPLTPSGLSIGDFMVVDGSVDNVREEVFKIAPKELKRLYKEQEEKIKELEEKDIKTQQEAEKQDLLLI